MFYKSCRSFCLSYLFLLHLNTNVKGLYRTLVRSDLEYCSSVWSPSTVSDTKAIESIQRAATRYILNYPEIKYDQRCTMLYRREITDLLYVFKCIKGYYDVAWHNNIEVISNSSLRSGNVLRAVFYV